MGGKAAAISVGEAVANAANPTQVGTMLGGAVELDDVQANTGGDGYGATKVASVGSSIGEASPCLLTYCASNNNRSTTELTKARCGNLR